MHALHQISDRAPMNFGGMRRLGRAILLLAALLCHFQPAVAQNVVTEQSLRAAMVFNFLKFTDFPPTSAPDPQRLRLCFLVGDASQAEAFAALAGRKVGSRELVVVRLGERGDSCQVLYVDSRQRWNTALESRSLGGALTIGDYRGFIEDGGIIGIDLQPDGNRFDINLARARVAHLRMSPQLLRLARRIHE